MDVSLDTAAINELRETAGPEFLVELIDTFIAEAPGMLKDLREGLATADANRFRRAAHSLKSNAATFGATRLAEIARQLEHGGFASGADQAAATVAALESEFSKVAETLTKLKGTLHG